MALSTDPPLGAAIDPATAIGTVRLTVADLDRSRSFYETALGLQPFALEDGGLALGRADEQALIELHGDGSARPLFACVRMIDNAADTEAEP